MFQNEPYCACAVPNVPIFQIRVNDRGMRSAKAVRQSPLSEGEKGRERGKKNLTRIKREQKCEVGQTKFVYIPVGCN